MSEESQKAQVGIIGDGCAALSLVARAPELPDYAFTVYRPKEAPQSRDHMWGFWSTSLVSHAEALAEARWNQWSIVTAHGQETLGSRTKPYNAIRRSTWMENCRTKAEEAGVSFLELEEGNRPADALWFDSRPPTVPLGMMLQHFVGLEVETNVDTFDASTVTLMDFRVDQSRGMHFIYILPFSERRALVESTLFSPNVEDDQYYTDTIDTYLRLHCGNPETTIAHKEKGVIPLGLFHPHEEGIPGIGSNGGAIRPSSGYAFPFIQAQIQRGIETSGHRQLEFRSPHRSIDLWMDAVMLSVLRWEPGRAPDIFLRMARKLDGDEFARFLSGEANWALRLKLIFALPKWPFLKAVVRLITRTRTLAVGGGRWWTS